MRTGGTSCRGNRSDSDVAEPFARIAEFGYTDSVKKSWDALFVLGVASVLALVSSIAMPADKVPLEQAESRPEGSYALS